MSLRVPCMEEVSNPRLSGAVAGRAPPLSPPASWGIEASSPRNIGDGATPWPLQSWGKRGGRSEAPYPARSDALGHRLRTKKKKIVMHHVHDGNLELSTAQADYICRTQQR